MQRFAIASCYVFGSLVYILDEPSCFLDVKQRMQMCQVIRKRVNQDTYTIVVEHDLTVLDYLSDYICCLYGQANGFGVVSSPCPVAEGINAYLDGYMPPENIRFRDEKLTFKYSTQIDQIDQDEKGTFCKPFFSHSNFEVKLGSGENTFRLNVEKSTFSSSEVIVLLAENGTGKSTYLKALAKFKNYEVKSSPPLPSRSFSYKPQMLIAHFTGTVKELFESKAPQAYGESLYVLVLQPLGILEFEDCKVKELSGGQLQLY